jgi:carboxylate-amine ligase
LGVIVRRLGVEEELLLTDAVTGQLRPVASEVVAACKPSLATSHGADRGAQVKHEFFLSQVEVATRPHISLEAIRGD